MEQNKIEHTKIESKQTQEVLEPVLILGTGEPWQNKPLKSKSHLFFKRLAAYFLDYLFLFSLISLIRSFWLLVTFPNLSELYQNYFTLQNLFLELLERQIALRELKSFSDFSLLYQKIFIECRLPDSWQYHLQTCRQVADFFRLNNLITGILTLSLSAFYHLLLPISNWQATLGKKILGLKIVNLQGQKITFIAAFARYSLWLVYNFSQMLIFSGIMQEFFLSLYTLISLVFLLSAMLIFLDSKQQGLHDKIAQTVVVSKS